MCGYVSTMVQLSAMSRFFAKFDKRIIFINRRGCRFYSRRPHEKPKRAHIVDWFINGTNSSYSSVNATLSTLSTKIAFNCGEGLQRLIAEKKVKRLPLFHYIFITRLDWRCVAGLPGVILTLNANEAKYLNVYGPSTLNLLCDPFMQFMPKSDFDVTIIDCENKRTCTDDTFSIQTIPLRNPMEKNAKVFAYAGDVPAYRSRINIEKCVDLNVPAGPLILQLANGCDVTLEDGSVVRPTDVSEYYPKLNFLVVDIPTVDYLHHVENSEILLHEDGAENTVFHFSPPKIIATNEYQMYMRKFPAETVHVMTNEKFVFSGHTSVHRQQTQLNHIHGQVFPILGEKIDHMLNATIEPNERDLHIENFIPNRIFTLRPTKRTADHLKLEPQEWLKRLAKSTESIETFHRLHKEHIVKHPISERANEYPKIVFLGTGASCPFISRNVSGILVRLSPDSSILMDCGEGTLGQLFRFYGDRTHDVLTTLKLIFISHMHADHYMGLFNLLRQVQEIKSSNPKQPITLMGPIPLQKRLDSFNAAVQDVNGSYSFLCNNQLFCQNRTRHTDQLISDIGLVDIETCLVKHIADSFGVSLSVRQPQTNSVFKLTYSGDTTPCKNLIAIGRNSTILIHEATLEDDLALSADHKKHSTVSQAISQGTKMNAKYTILTHLSQRYRLPRLIRPLPPNVTIAIDNMELVESDLPLTHHLYNVMHNIHQEELDEYDAKAELRNYWNEKTSNKLKQI